MRSILRFCGVASVFMAGPLAAQFTLSSATTSAQSLATVGTTGTVTETGSVTVTGGSVAVTVTGNNVTVANAGSIAQTGSGRAVRFNNAGITSGTLTNAAGATISAVGDDAVQSGGSTPGGIRVTNAGTISSTGGQALDFDNATVATTIENQVGGLITATGSDAVRPGLGGLVTNAGTIRAIPVAGSGSDGVDAQSNTGVSVTNAGLIEGRHGITGGATTFAISITNQAGGEIRGSNGSGVNIDEVVATSGAMVTNAAGATIFGTYDGVSADGDGDGVDVDGVLTLENHGVIRALGAKGGQNGADGVAAGGGTINNYAGAEITGEITSGDTALAANGILIDDSDHGSAVAATTITNAGLIRAHNGFAVKFIGDFADTVTNQASGVLRAAGGEAAVQTGEGNDTVINAGAIQHDGGHGSVAVALGGGDDTLTLSGSAPVVLGRLDGGAGSDALRFDLDAAGTTALGGDLLNFETIGAFGGTTTLAGVTIAGGTSSTFTIAAAAAVVIAGEFASDAALTVEAAGRLTFATDAVYHVELGGLVANALAGYDQVVVDGGTVDLGGAALSIVLTFTPNGGDAFTLFDLIDGGTLAGTFAGLAEGDVLAADGWLFAISYVGGTGNDVVLTALSAVPEPSTMALVLGSVAFALVSVRRREALRSSEPRA